MKRSVHRRTAIATLVTGAMLAPRVLRAQMFPSRPIRIIVPVSPGGGVDAFARLIAAKAQTQRDVRFVVENRTGGNSTIGGLDVQRAAPDDYTVLFHASTHNVARLVMRNAPYDPVTDFTPIALAGRAPLVHIIANDRPERTLDRIVAAAKAKPEHWSFATAQLGAPGHLAELAFNQYTGLNLPVVVYRGTAPAVNDVTGGHVPMMIEAILALLPMVRGGAVRAVAVTSLKRSALAPDIPTTAEVGLPQLAFGAWWAMWGPPHVPAELVATLNGWVNEAVKALDAEGRLAALRGGSRDARGVLQLHRGRPAAQRENPQRREIPTAVGLFAVRCVSGNFGVRQWWRKKLILREVRMGPGLRSFLVGPFRHPGKPVIRLLCANEP
jgi:tripartite-type tricarboxylate transporter receptor subunit TctC